MADKTPDPQQEALFREVDEDLREEQMKRLWKKYGGAVIGVAVLIVAVVAGYQGWQSWTTSRQAADAQAYETAIRAINNDDPVAGTAQLVDVAQAGRTGHAALARLSLAGLALEENRVDDALAAYAALADDDTVEPVMRDVGRLLFALHGIDRLDPAQVEARLAPLTAPNHAFRFSAREAQGLLALRRGDTATAVEVFTGLSADTAAPAALRERAGMMSAALGADVAGANGNSGTQEEVR